MTKNNYEKLSDKSLLKDLFGVFTSSKKRRKAWEILYQRYYAIMYKYINQLTKNENESMDIIHETWISILDKKPRLINPMAFKSYLLRTAKNIYINKEIRAKKIKSDEDIINLKEHRKNQLEKLLLAEKYRYLDQLIEDTLKNYEKDKAALLSRYLQDTKNIKKIASDFSDKFSEANVYKIIERFKRDLRKQFKY